MVEPAGVLCDMDGLLLDSERLARDAFVRACTEIGWEADLSVYHRCIGSTHETTEEILTDHFGPEFPYKRLDARWSDLYHARLAQGPVPVKTGARELLEQLHARSTPVALVTSTRRSTALSKLEASGLLGYFDALVCGGESERGKPHPHPYLAAADRLGLATLSCWALEDSENGVRSALEAGCTVFQVPDLVQPGDQLRRLGHTVVESLLDVLQLLYPEEGEL